MRPEEKQRVERRLAAIFAADVAGYSRLMNQDEAGTLRALAAAREIMDRLISEHGGRIANTAGDSVLAEFPSAVDAVQCAVAVQERLAQANGEKPEERRLKFRIGVHVGDVVVRAGDLLGDGVNVAARLEGIAEPGGIAISGAAHGYVRKALPLAYTDLGEQHVKNIDEPVRAYSIGRAEAPSPSTSEPKALSLPDRPSIAVLPFANMSGDPEQEYLVDGITDDLIIALVRTRWLLVIARNSSFAFKGKAVQAKQAAKDLGVHYVLEGSVRKSAQRLRISVQLVEAETDASIWAERYDRNLIDMFSLQDEIVEAVAGAIEPELLRREGKRAVSRSGQSLTTWDTVRQGMWEFHKVSPESHRAARALFKTAVQNDASSPDGYLWLARVDAGLAAYGWSDDPEVLIEEGTAAALRAVQLDERNPYAHYAVAVISTFGGAPGPALTAAERALALSPSFALGHLILGAARLFAGMPQEAIEPFEHGLRLNPFDPQNFTWHLLSAVAYYFAGQPERGLDAAQRALIMRPHWSPALKLVAVCTLKLGHEEHARSALAELHLSGDAEGDLLHALARRQPTWMEQLTDAIEGAPK